MSELSQNLPKIGPYHSSIHEKQMHSRRLRRVRIGNDEVVKETGIKTMQTSGPKETVDIITKLIY
jgi:hypothetical protein